MAIRIGGRGNDSQTGTNSSDLMIGGAGNDTQMGGGGNDFMSAGSGNDLMDGGEGRDLMTGGSGNDTMIGGAGDDTMIGGSGFDTAIMSGNFRDYVLQFFWLGWSVEGADGHDQLYQVEAIQFDDGTLYLDGRNNGPFAYADSASTLDNEVLSVAAADGVLANDQDFEGDSLTVIGVNGDAPSVGNQITLASGALLTLNADGSYDYDAGNAFPSLANGETATDSFTYSVSDGHGGVDTATVTVTVTGTNSPPELVADPPVVNAMEDGEPVVGTFAVDDPDPDDDTSTLTYLPGGFSTGKGFMVSNGDGTFTYDPLSDFQGLAEGQTTIASFTFTATDSHGASLEFTQSVTVTGVNDAPSIAGGVAGPSFEDDPPLTRAYRFTDVDSDDSQATLTYVITDQPSFGSVVDNGDGTFTFTFGDDFQDLGDFEPRTVTFGYTATDSHGATTAFTEDVVVFGLNDAPEAFADNASTDEDTAVVIDVLGNDSDVDASDTLTVTVIDDSTTLGTVTNNGTDVTYDPNGLFDYLAVGESATDSFTYTISDGHGGTATASVTVTINGANHAPTAGNNGVIVNENSSTQIQAADLLANDSDVDGDALKIVGFSNAGITGSLTGAISISTGAYTSFTFGTGSAFDYLAFGQNAATSFTYTVSDGHGGTDTATVNITVLGANGAPEAVDDDGIVTDEDTPIDITGAELRANDSDVDGGLLRITGIEAAGLLGSITINGSSATEGITDLHYDPNNQFEYLADGESATDSFTYTLSDSNGATATATVTITVNGVNDAPTASDDSGETDADASTVIDVLGNDSDPDTSDNLFVSSVDDSGLLGQVTNNGVDLTYDPAGAFDSLLVGQSATETFSYTVADGHGGSDTATVTVTINGTAVANAKPLAVDDALALVESDLSVATVTEPQRTVFLDVLANDSDPDGDALAITQLLNDWGGNLQIAADGSGVILDGTELASLLGSGDAFLGTFGYIVSDGHGKTDVANVAVLLEGAGSSGTGGTGGTGEPGGTGGTGTIEYGVIKAAIFVGSLGSGGAGGAGTVLTPDVFIFEPGDGTASLNFEPVDTLVLKGFGLSFDDLDTNGNGTIGMGDDLVTGGTNLADPLVLHLSPTDQLTLTGTTSLDESHVYFF